MLSFVVTGIETEVYMFFFALMLKAEKFQKFSEVLQFQFINFCGNMQLIALHIHGKRLNWKSVPCID